MNNLEQKNERKRKKRINHSMYWNTKIVYDNIVSNQLSILYLRISFLIDSVIV